MSWQASADAKQITRYRNGAALTATDKCVLMLLADYSNPQSGYAFPSVATLAHYAGLKPRGTQRALARLEAGGVIAIQRRRVGPGINLSNRYTITAAPTYTTPVPEDTTPVPEDTTLLYPGTPPLVQSGAPKPQEEPQLQPQAVLPKTTTTSSSLFKVSESLPGHFPTPREPDSPEHLLHLEQKATAAVLAEVWAYYCERLGRPASYAFTPERRAMGEQGLAACIQLAESKDSGAPLEDAGAYMKFAIDRLATDDFHNATGKHKGKQKYLDWQQLFQGKNYPCPQKLTDFWLDDDKFGG